MQTSRPDLLQGSGRPIVIANAWRGGRCVARHLQITAGSLTIKAGQAVRSDLQLTIIDPSGKLAPTADGALSPFGSEIELRGGHQVGGRNETYPLGWYRITGAHPTQGYRMYESTIDAPRYVSAGVTVDLRAADRAIKVQRDLLVNGEQPIKTTVLAEIRRLLQGVVPWTPAGIADRPMRTGAVTYDGDRLKAVGLLADLLACDLIFTPTGAATLVPKVPPLVSAWDLPRGDTLVIGSIDSEMSSDDVHNAVFARSSATEGSPLVGRAFDHTPGISWAGPYGRVPLVIDVDLAGSQAELDRAARNELAMEQRSRWQIVTLQVPANFALEVGSDVVSIPMPKASVLGQVVSAQWPLTQGLMTIDVAVDPFVWENAQ